MQKDQTAARTVKAPKKTKPTPLKIKTHLKGGIRRA
jgi:hypothetical protein